MSDIASNTELICLEMKAHTVQWLHYADDSWKVRFIGNGIVAEGEGKTKLDALTDAVRKWRDEKEGDVSIFKQS